MVFGFMVLVLAYTVRIASASPLDWIWINDFWQQVTAAPAVQAVGDQASSDAYNCYAGNSWGWFNVPLVHANAVASFIGNQGNSKSNCRVTTSDRNGCHLVAEIKGAEAWLCVRSLPGPLCLLPWSRYGC